MIFNISFFFLWEQTFREFVEFLFMSSRLFDQQKLVNTLIYNYELNLEGKNLLISNKHLSLQYVAIYF